ncbi:MAG: hypothetical protein IT329_06355, partial [Caldilineaceae bacterium]|nr:hypothetical protein [Caldilineaceae bacterium]
SALPVLALPVTAGVLWLSREAHAGRGDGRSQFRAVAGVLLALALAGVSFFVTSPYAVLDWRNFVQATLVEQGQMVRGVADMPFTRQYRNTTPYLYFVQQQVQWGLGWPLGLAGLAGSLYMLGELARSLTTLVRQWFGRGQGGRPLADYEVANVLMWAWIVPYFGLTGAFLAKFNRYMSPILPFVALFAAALVWRLWRGWGVWEHRPIVPRVRRWAAIGVAAVALGGGLFWSLAYVNGVYRSEHPWITASRWIYQHAPRGSVILWELWDDPLPKSIPGEPGMDMGSTGLSNIDWSPYEEDTAEKFEILKAKLREADYVAYSSKRIYDSVDELPERYPMTNLYYEAMWDRRLGFELAAEFTTPPRLFGREFDDRHADESWSLYDHPQVTVFRKVRDLSDAEYDALLGGTWETAIPHYRGKDSPLSPLLEVLGLGSSPSGAEHGLVSALIGLLAGSETGADAPQVQADLMLDTPPGALPVVDNYRWNRAASESPWLAVGVWWLAVTVLGWAAWPLVFPLAGALRDRGYLIGKTAGWLIAGWLMWVAASVGLMQNTVVNAWLMALLLAVAGGLAAWRQWAALGAFVRRNWGLLIAGEALWVAAYLAFVLVRMANPDLWQPWFGGEKFMEFAFLNGILRSPTFPPLDPHFAGGIINYYYYGIYLVGYLIKLTGIYAEVAFNLAIPMLFAMAVGNSFALAHSAWALARPAGRWRDGLAAALLAPLFITVLGNLDGLGQVVRALSERSAIQVQSALPLFSTVAEAGLGLVRVMRGQATLPAYDFWGPSRVIPNTINEFPYWSFLFADLHPHLIGIPLSLVFLAVIFVLLADYHPEWRRWGRRGLGVAVAGAFLLGTLASVNLWELPTYFGLGVLALLVAEFRAMGRIRWPRILAVAALYLAVALVCYWPFFASYVNVGASGVGWVRAGDSLGTWLLIWGFLGFVIGSWLLYSGAQRPDRERAGQASGADTALVSALPAEGDSVDELEQIAALEEEAIWDDLEGAAAVAGVELPAARTRQHASRPTGIERFLSTLLRRFDRLPRFLYLHSCLVRRPTFGYLLGVAVLPLAALASIGALLWGREVLALCLPLLGIALLTLWRRGSQADPAAVFAGVLAATGLAILAGTQVVYLKDFLQGGDWYRMNTLFKFFIQVWVLWGLAAAVALPRLWQAATASLAQPALPRERSPSVDAAGAETPRPAPWWDGRRWPALWQTGVVVLLVASLTYVALGTPARLSQRLTGWRPAFGTLNALDYMGQGSYTWPDDSHRILLAADHAAIEWLLAHVRGNPVIVETSELDYYRAGSSRVASLTGLSGLLGMHKSEQRPGEQVGARDGLLREFWATPDIDRTQAIIDELGIGLVYVGQLERYLHPEGVNKLAEMAALGMLGPIYEHEGVVIYAVPGRLIQEDGLYFPQQAPTGQDVGEQVGRKTHAG